MEGALSASRSASHENVHGGYSPDRSITMRPDDGRYKSSAGGKNENQAPMSLPAALNSILRTTTEIGHR
jgi:hypothetical protein